MKAVLIRAFGDSSVLEYADIAKPEPRPGHVLVKVEAVGTNYYDILVRSGIVSQAIPLPHIIGSDAVGTVEEVGEGVSSVSPGDRVIVAPGYPTEPSEWSIARENEAPSYFPTGTFERGAYTQYMEVNERWLLADKTGLSFEEVASMPLVLVTAVNAVKTKGELKAGQKVLVQGGASGSGSMVIQVAKAMGASVITTVSTPEKAAVAKAMGADEVVFYRDTNFVDAVKEWTNGDGVDLVVDPVGGTTFPGSINCMKPRAILVNFGLVAGIEATIPHLYQFFRNELTVRGSWMGSMDELRFGLDLVAQGKIKGAVDKVVPMSAAKEAHGLIESAQVNGKLVLNPSA